MAQPVPLKRLIVARWDEDTAWTSEYSGWQTVVVQKDRDLPNEGREASSYLWALSWLRARIRLGDVIVFLQGEPYAHCPELKQQLEQPITGFCWLGGIHTSSGDGSPHHPGLPVAERHQEWTGRPWPGGSVQFAAGAQFAITGRQARLHTAARYRNLQAAMCEGDNPWVAERLWAAVFDAAVYT